MEMFRAVHYPKMIAISHALPKGATIEIENPDTVLIYAPPTKRWVASGTFRLVGELDRSVNALVEIIREGVQNAEE
jgi:hypothetical protein